MRLGTEEAARALGVTEETVRRWIRQGRIPARVSGGKYTFRRVELERWAGTHHVSLRWPGPTEGAAGESARRAPLHDAIARGGVHFDVEGSDVPAAIRAAVALCPIPEGVDREEVARLVLDRESITSTGIGNGIAIPHPRTPIAGVPFDPRITACFLKEPLDFHAPDGIPVFALFLMLSATIRQHLELLSLIGRRILHDDGFVAFLRECRSAEALFARLADRFETPGTSP